MISRSVVQKICFEFDIGNYLSIDKIHRGVLNDNYILITDTGKYFIKSVREKSKDKLDMIYGVEYLMKSYDIPAVVMLKTKSAKNFLADDDQVYTVYPFIESEERDNYLNTDYQKMGEMLGKIHLVGSGNVSKVPDLRQFRRLTDQTILEKLETYKEEIKIKSVKDDVDEQFLEYIDFKLLTYPKVISNELPNDTLIHGDYHPENLLFDRNTREIISVCDWEKAEFGPRAYELARSLLYSCFYYGYKQGQALINSKLFLESYLSDYPMNTNEVADGLDMRIHRMVLSSWIEELYYKERDSRANKFIQHEMGLINSVVNENLSVQIKDLLN